MIIRGRIEYLPHTGPCPSCGGPVAVHKATFFELPEPKPEGPCVYSKWLRDGIAEDGGICVGMDDDGKPLSQKRRHQRVVRNLGNR